jgi:proline iminopeptidase
MYTSTYNLYPEIEPFNKSTLKVDDVHSIYYEECGSPQGIPVIFLHGGPGSSCNPTQRRFFDPKHYRIILLDQRGCGRSTPQGGVAGNTTDDLVNDLEILRHHLGIARWHVFGGSWGSTLALAYAVKYASHVISLVLRGIFLSRPAELNWFLYGAQQFYPEVWHNLISFLPESERNDVLAAYAKRIFSDDAQINVAAASQWNAYESSIMRLKPADASNSVPKTPEDIIKEQPIEVARARVQIHYIQHQCFIDGDAILNEVAKLNDIPTVIVQGRYDMVCPPTTAWELARAMPHAEFVMIADAGHSAMETGVTSALVAATEKFKKLT